MPSSEVDGGVFGLEPDVEDVGEEFQTAFVRESGRNEGLLIVCRASTGATHAWNLQVGREFVFASAISARCWPICIGIRRRGEAMRA